MAIPALPPSDDARFQAALSSALTLPHDESVEHATDGALDLEACKRELMAALEWAGCNRDKWMSPSGVAPAREERVRGGDGLEGGGALGLIAAQSVIVAGLASRARTRAARGRSTDAKMGQETFDRAPSRVTGAIARARSARETPCEVAVRRRPDPKRRTRLLLQETGFRRHRTEARSRTCQPGSVPSGPRSPSNRRSPTTGRAFARFTVEGAW